MVLDDFKHYAKVLSGGAMFFTCLPAFKDKVMMLWICHALGGRELVGVMCMGSFNWASGQTISATSRLHCLTVNIQMHCGCWACTLIIWLYSSGLRLLEMTSVNQNFLLFPSHSPQQCVKRSVPSFNRIVPSGPFKAVNTLCALFLSLCIRYWINDLSGVHELMGKVGVSTGS